MTNANQHSFKLSILTPEEAVFSGEVSMAIVPGEAGLFGVLPGHAAMIATLKAGSVDIFQANQLVKQVHISGGFAEVNGSECIIMAEHVETRNEGSTNN